MSPKCIIITSIHGITDAVKSFARFEDWHVIVVGDKKTPPLQKNPFPNVTFLSVRDQEDMDFSFLEFCPFNHYVRKNLGYLYAIRHGATWIADTDDDNIPYEQWGMGIAENAHMETVSGTRFVNMYRFFTDASIWPRGFPLNEIQNQHQPEVTPPMQHRIAVWQGLADKDPDVDAIYRLTVNTPVTFGKRSSLALAPGTYCPINSQNTVWTMKACFPYLYLPVSVTFRFCDILRGYVAQRGIWALQAKLAFTSASVYQERNVHDFMKDFVDEIPCYTQISTVVDFLDSIELEGNPSRDIVAMYNGLKKIGVVDERDCKGVQAFVRDLENP